MQRVFSLKEKVHGSDEPILFLWQNTIGNYIATSGPDCVIKIWDRRGNLQQEVHLPGACSSMGWSEDGDYLCAACESSSTIFMWDSNQEKTLKIPVDSGAKDSLSMLRWSKVDQLLAIGTSKGNLILYDHKIGRKTSILGKHSRKIICGCWSQQNKLALGGSDNLLTISDESGQTLHQTSLRGSPSRIQFSEMKGGKADSGENTVSLVVGKKTLFLFKLYDPENVIELAFQSRYGKISAYQWYGDGYIMIGFSDGYFVVISTHEKEIGQELFQVRNHHDYLSSIDICSPLNYAASCGDTSIRIHDLRQLSEITAIIELEDEPKGLHEIKWNTDGQILAISTRRGGLHCYLTKLTLLGDTYGSKLSYLTSLQEVTVVNKMEGEPPVKVAINVEPSFIACGAYHIAVGMNNRAWFYFLADKDSHKPRDREYLGSIEKMSLNADYAAVLFEGKVQLHMIDQGMHTTIEEREAKLFPERDDVGQITCSSLTNEFLIYGTNNGSIHFFYIEDWVQVNIFRHSGAIRNIFPDGSGSHLGFFDDKGEGFIYNPVDDGTYQIPSLPSNSQKLLWDLNPYDKGVFMVHNDTVIQVYMFCREALRGSEVVLIGEMRLPFSQIPLLLYNGSLTLHVSSGQTSTILLETHSFLESSNDKKPRGDEKCLNQAIALRKWRDAWKQCFAFNKKEIWLRFGAAALNALDVELAIRIYRFLEDSGMVLALDKLKDVEDSRLLAGFVASFIGDFDLAQDLFLASSRPSAALDLRRDLMHWDTALQLANRLDPTQIPFIAKEYAQQLEFTGNYSSALSHFEQGITRDPKNKDHDETCAAGVARTAIRVGDIRRGIQIALSHPSRTLQKECATILESMRQYAESADLFEKSEYYDKAASVYIRSKNWTRVGALLPKVTSPKIHFHYAKSRETDGKYLDAANSYHSAKDYDNEIRVLLDHLKDPERAVKVVKESGSVEGAKSVSRFFVKLGDFGSAIEFLVLSKCNEEAFQMARYHGQMETYAEVIGDDATPEDFRSIAVYFENENNHIMAGKFYARCGNYPQAMKHLLKCSAAEMKQALEMAIKAAAKANDEKLNRQLVDFLMGETDGMPKDPNYLFKFYVALKRYPEAARTAIIISKEEQNQGNYRSAHDMLFSMMRELQRRNIKIPSEMEMNLLILHSYLLAKAHLKRGDHSKAARMLIRVAENISKFPEHIVPLLTSTVIECHKANLKNSSFSYASMLMRPEYRNNIDGKYKKKIEQIVRKSSKTEDPEESTSPCPYCDFALDNSQLICPNCRKNIPYCIATGRHIQRTNLSSCPKCEFPAIYSEFEKYLNHEPLCPMCSETVNPTSLLRVKNPEKYLGKS